MSQTVPRLEVVCALWRKPWVAADQAKKPYGNEHVRGLREMLRAQCPEVTLICVSNLPGVEESADLVVPMPDRVAGLPSQYPKLWLQSAEFADAVGHGRRLLFTDLDVVVTGDWSALVEPGADPVFRANYPDLRGAEVPRAARRRLPRRAEGPRASPPFSTSLFQYSTGSLQAVWDRFSPRRAERIGGWTGSDQRWMNWMLGPDVRVWAPDARFAQMGELLRTGDRPSPACMVVTCGHTDPPWSPAVRAATPWVTQYYPDRLLA